MKPSRILLFFLSVFLILFGIWYLFPSDGVKVGKTSTLRFPCYEQYLSDLRDSSSTVDVDSVLVAARKSYEALLESRDSLAYYFDYFENNPDRISLPDGDSIFFDSVFDALDSASVEGRHLRIIHYGDSQLEMDRISAILRQKLQERFGGSGPGMVPMIQRISSVSVMQKASGSLSRYARVGDSLSRRDPAQRYGVLMQYTRVNGSGQFNFRSTENRYAQPLASNISKVSILLGRNSKDLKLSLKCDTLKVMTTILDTAKAGVSVVTWDLPVPVAKGTIDIKGSAEVYGIMLDGEPGVTVDNVAMRGCAGTIFTGIDSTVMAESLKLTDTPLIILEFGGNAMPGIASMKAVSWYVENMKKQFDYFRKIAPDAKLLFVGPADMCKSVKGSLVTWPLLPQLNDSLKVACTSNGVAYWDTFRMMGGVGSMRNWVHHSPQLAGPDYIHFTTRGANEVGSALAGSLLVYHDFYRLRKRLPAEMVNDYFINRRDSLEALSALSDTTKTE